MKSAKKTSWRKELKKALKDNNETWADVQSCTMTEEDLDDPFIQATGLEGTEAHSFTLWTKETVYFLLEQDGLQTVAFVSRNPDGRATRIGE